MSIVYSEYMQSPEWRERRRYMIGREGGRCSLCDADPTRANPLNVHHRTYKRLGREWDGDLIVLCLECHDRHHGKLPDPPADLSRMDELVTLLAEDRIAKAELFELVQLQHEARIEARRWS